MHFRVLLAEDAERNIEDIYRYIASHDTVGNADHVLTALEGACERLSKIPERSNTPKELAGLGITDYRETHYKPYRVIYRIMGRDVVVYCAALSARRACEGSPPKARVRFASSRARRASASEMTVICPL